MLNLSDVQSLMCGSRSSKNLFPFHVLLLLLHEAILLSHGSSQHSAWAYLNFRTWSFFQELANEYVTNDLPQIQRVSYNDCSVIDWSECDESTWQNKQSSFGVHLVLIYFKICILKYSAKFEVFFYLFNYKFTTTVNPSQYNKYRHAQLCQLFHITI